MNINYQDVPTYFLIFQIAVIGLFVLFHFLLGLKRGFTKTLWNLFGNIVIVVALFYVLGLIQLRNFVTEEMFISYFNMIPIPGMDANQLIDAGAMPLVVAIADLSLKISLFAILYFVLRIFIQMIVFGIPWLFIKKAVKPYKKQRLLGGLVGIGRGAFAGFIAIFPILILINTVVGQGFEIDDPEYQELSVAISKANETNFVRYVNDVGQVNNTGLADWFFDLAFKSEVNESEVIIWRKELTWISEGAKAILPDILDENADYDYTAQDIGRFEGLFTSFAESQLINSSFKPLFKFSLQIINENEQTNMFTQEELQDIFDKIDATDINLSNDFEHIYLAVSDLLTIQRVSEWEASFNNPDFYLGLDEDNQTLFLSAIRRLISLDLLKLGDIAVEVALYQDFVQDQLVWLSTPTEKIDYLDQIRTKIEDFEGTFIQSSLSELANLLENTIYKFPGIDTDDDGIADIDLADFISSIADMSVVLNEDEVYHTWVKSVLTEFSGLSMMDVLFQPMMDFGIHQLTNTEVGWTDAELDNLILIIDNNFSDNDDLKRELLWMADVYKEIGKLNIGNDLSNNEDPKIMLDNILSTNDGRLQFKATINKILDGVLISDLTNQMSNVLIKKYLTEPLDLTDPLYRAMDLTGFAFKDEVNIVVDVVIGLYDSGLLLQDALDENVDMLNVLLPVIVDYAKVEANRDLLLSSDILYSFIDYNISNLDMIDVPSIALEVSGKYNGWIKKSELSIVLDIFDGVFEVMDAQSIDVSTLLSQVEEEQANTILAILKDYLADSVNRDLVLSSDVLYYTLNEMVSDLEFLEVPNHTLVTDTNSPYHTWINKDELDKLFQVISVIDIVINPGMELDISTITNTSLQQVILIESAILTRFITTMLVDANLFDIPNPAFETLNLKDLTQDELVALSQLLIDLNIELSVITDPNGVNDLLNVYIEDLINIDYEDSFIIKSFITMAVKEGLGTPHPLAMDSSHSEILSNLEISEIFKVLGTLDENPSLRLNDLMATIEPNNLSFETVNLIVDNSDSITIRAQVSDNILTSNFVTGLTLNDDVYEDDNGSPVTDLITYGELKSIIKALNHFAVNEEDAILDVVTNIDMNTITLQLIDDVNAEKSLIMKTVISKEVKQNLGETNIHPNTIDSNGEIYQTDLDDLFRAVLVLGPNKPLTDLVNDLSDNINIPTINSMRAENSLIFEGKMSKTIHQAIIDQGYPVRDNAYQNASDPVIGKLSFGFIDPAETTKLLNALDQMDNNMGNPLSDIMNTVEPNAITTHQLISSVDEESIIIRTMMSDIVIESVTAARVVPAAFDAVNNPDLTQVELVNFIESLGILDATYNNGDPNDDASVLTIATNLAANANNLKVGEMIDLNIQNSLIIRKFMSEGIITSVGVTNVRDDAYEILSLEFISSTEISNLLSSLHKVSTLTTGSVALGLKEPISSVTTNIQTNIITPSLLIDLANDESIITYRIITNEIADTGVSIPNKALQLHPYTGNDISKTELIALANAINEFGLSTIEIGTIDVGTVALIDVKDVLTANSYISNRMISMAVNDVNLDTLESHEGEEDILIDIQVSELNNLVDAFIALNINDVDSAQTVSVMDLFIAAQTIGEAEFNGYIDYQAPYDPLTEDIGLTIVKDFLISKLDNQIPNPLDVPNNYQVQNREDLNKLIFP